MTQPRIVAIADAAAAVGPAGAPLAFDLGRFARACVQAGVPWSLWLRAHGWTADRWLASVRTLAYVRDLGGSIGVSAPADGPAGWRAAKLTAAGVTRVHVPAAAWCDWQGDHATLPRWVACHGPAQAAGALAQGAAAAVLSPVWATQSKPDAPALGLQALAAACAAHPGKIVALGGIDAATADLAVAAGATAVATLSAWRTDAIGLVAAVASADRMV